MGKNVTTEKAEPEKNIVDLLAAEEGGDIDFEPALWKGKGLFSLSIDELLK